MMKVKVVLLAVSFLVANVGTADVISSLNAKCTVKKRVHETDAISKRWKLYGATAKTIYMEHVINRTFVSAKTLHVTITHSRSMVLVNYDGGYQVGWCNRYGQLANNDITYWFGRGNSLQSKHTRMMALNWATSIGGESTEYRLIQFSTL